MRPRPSSRGASAVEFALVLPILVLLLFGIIEFGRGYNAKTTLTHAAREGARAAAVESSPAAQVAEANAAVSAATPALSGVTVNVTTCTPGNDVTVTVNYSLDYSIPFFNDGTWNLSEQGVMRCGG